VHCDNTATLNHTCCNARVRKRSERSALTLSSKVELLSCECELLLQLLVVGDELAVAAMEFVARTQHMLALMLQLHRLCRSKSKSLDNKLLCTQLFGMRSLRVLQARAFILCVAERELELSNTRCAQCANTLLCA